MKLNTSIRKRFRVSNKVKKVASKDRFRLSISRSSKNISAQIIDDSKNVTLLSASSVEKDLKSSDKVNKTELSKLVAQKLAKKAQEKKITKIYFDRGSYKYHGRIKVFAETLKRKRDGILIMENIKDKKTDDILEKLVHINRITKVVKGGRRFGFSALVVVGNQAGKIGIAHAKAKQVPDAIKKANEMARRKLTHIPLREGRTIHHDVKAKDGSGRIVLRAASKGTGIIAGGPVRAVCEVLGVKDIVAKSMGTSNAHNVIRATMKALMKQSSPKQISAIRNKKISEIIEKRG